MGKAGAAGVKPSTLSRLQLQARIQNAVLARLVFARSIGLLLASIKLMQTYRMWESYRKGTGRGPLEGHWRAVVGLALPLATIVALQAALMVRAAAVIWPSVQPICTAGRLLGTCSCAQHSNPMLSAHRRA